jgi:hypothetical protein
MCRTPGHQAPPASRRLLPPQNFWVAGAEPTKRRHACNRYNCAARVDAVCSGPEGTVGGRDPHASALQRLQAPRRHRETAVSPLPARLGVCHPVPQARAMPPMQAPLRTRTWLFHRGHVSQPRRGDRRHLARMAHDGMARKVRRRRAASDGSPPRRGVPLTLSLCTRAVAAPRPSI